MVTTTSGRQPRGSESAREDRALFGWSPPARKADTSLKRLVDRLILGRVPTVIILVFGVLLLNIQDLPLNPSPALVLAGEGTASLIMGGWCAVNFWRCRHAHCLITGRGWLALTAVCLWGVLIGHSIVGGYEGDAFDGVLLTAVAFEVIWVRSGHSRALGAGTK